MELDFSTAFFCDKEILHLCGFGLRVEEMDGGAGVREEGEGHHTVAIKLKKSLKYEV